MRFVSFGSLPFGSVANRLLGAAWRPEAAPQIFRVEVSSLVEHLRMEQGNGGSLRRGHAEPNPADHVLPHVEDRVARGRLQHFHGRDFFYRLDWRSRRRNQFCSWPL